MKTAHRRMPLLHPFVILPFLTGLLLLLAGCAEQNAPAPTRPLYMAAAPLGEPVYGPVNRANPFESIGLCHNDLVHACLIAARPWDTVSVEALSARAAAHMPHWTQAALGYSAAQAERCGRTAVAMRVDSSARRALAAYDAVSCTARERRFIRRIGDLLCTVGRPAEIERGLASIECDILAETWPSGDSTEILARVAISIAKHSYAYWKHLMLAVHHVGSAAALAKEADILIRVSTRAQIITAADVIAGVTAAEAMSGLGLEMQVGSAIVSGGGISVLVAIVVYFDDIVSFLSSLLPWNW